RFPVAFDQAAPILRSALVHGELSGASVASLMLRPVCAASGTAAATLSARTHLNPSVLRIFVSPPESGTRWRERTRKRVPEAPPVQETSRRRGPETAARAFA